MMKLHIILKKVFQCYSLAFIFTCLVDANPMVISTEGNSIRYRLGKLVDVQIGSGKLAVGIESGILSGIDQDCGAHGETNNVNAESSNISCQEHKQSQEIMGNAVLEELKSQLNENNLLIQKFTTSSVGISEYLDTEECYPVGIDKNRFCRRGHARNRSGKGNETIPRSCKEILNRGNNVSGVYQIQPIKSKKPFMVLCDMETKGGGWTHIQKRYDGTQDFFLGWREYKLGFGDLAGEFWIGLENISEMTAFVVNELLVEIVDRENVTKYAHYKVFQVSSEADGYALNTLKEYSGDAGDSLKYAIGSKFSAKDLDNDLHDGSCATICNGGWWFTACFEGFLNGNRLNTMLPKYTQYSGIHWKTLHNVEYNHAKSRMMIRTVEV